MYLFRMRYLTHSMEMVNFTKEFLIINLDYSLLSWGLYMKKRNKMSYEMQI